MTSNDYKIYFDCGHSRLRAGAFNKHDANNPFFTESLFFSDQEKIFSEIKKIIDLIEKNTNEYIKNINLMIDSPKMFSIGISISKKIDKLKLSQKDIQFLVQEAKQQVLKSLNASNIIHIIINNYKINNIDYDYLPEDIKCNFISLDIIFICLPEEIIEFFRNFFHKLNISINQIVCSSYAKALNYKDNFSYYKNITFVDIGFNKTSITTFNNNKIISLDVLPVGGNNITKDISKVLKIDLRLAEDLKIDFSKNKVLVNDKNFSLELLQKIVFARIEEILEISLDSIKLKINKTDQCKMILTGDGSKILNNQYKDKISLVNDVDVLEETIKDICNSGFKLEIGLNKQEVIVVPKKQVKHSFFEKLFHFFK